MAKIAFVILIGLALLGGGWWLVSTRLLAELPPPVHPTTQVVEGLPLDTALMNDPLPPVTTQSVRWDTPVRGSSNLPKVTSATKPEHAKYNIVQFDTLSEYPYRRWLPMGETDAMPPDQIPATVKALGGRPTCIAGFVQPLDLDDKGRVSHFMLMRSQSLCCYGAPLTLQDWIDVRLEGDQRIEPPLHVPVFVLGTLEVGEKMIKNYTESLYRLKAEKVLRPGEMP